MSEEKDPLRKFLSSSDLMIVDRNSSARVSLAATLISLGAVRTRLVLAGSMEEARAEIRRIKPRMIFCDFLVGTEPGLDLIQEQKKEYGEKAKDCFFILVTGNASQSVVARAAEEDVDGFVIKPYTLNTFKKCIADTLETKLNPSEYMKVVEKGKEQLAAGNLDQAVELFTSARKLDPKPTLACFYLGQVDLIRKALEDAGENYRQGLKYNKIHYKCLTGLYDLLMKQKNYEAAYDIVKRLAQYFPANPNRLAGVLRLAIMTSNYDDIEGYYRIFTQLDNRTDELIRYVCSALAVTGKYYLGRNTRSRALELFEKVAVTCAGRIQFMRYVVEALVDSDCTRDAADYLTFFPPATRGQPDYLMSALVVAGATRPSGEVVQLARDLINKGIDHPCVYLVLIKHSAKAGLADSAEHLCGTVSSKWPERQQDFAAALAEGTALHEKESGAA